MSYPVIQIYFTHDSPQQYINVDHATKTYELVERLPDQTVTANGQTKTRKWGIVNEGHSPGSRVMHINAMMTLDKSQSNTTGDYIYTTAQVWVDNLGWSDVITINPNNKTQSELIITMGGTRVGTFINGSWNVTPSALGTTFAVIMDSDRLVYGVRVGFSLVV